jgi:Mn2+/Fe2+ NRAMP family transporter
MEAAYRSASWIHGTCALFSGGGRQVTVVARANASSQAGGMADDNAKTNVSLTEEPPHTVLGILSRLGPGLIIAGSIVGSGELIATTATGAEAGFALLWLIIIGCVIKVWVQVELGRYTMVAGKTTMEAINTTPGPAFWFGWQTGGRDSFEHWSFANWMSIYWLVMFIVSLGQLGGIVGGVGQGLAITCPLTQTGRAYNDAVDERTRLTLAVHGDRAKLDRSEVTSNDRLELELQIANSEARIAELNRQINEPQDGKEPLKKLAKDDQYWAIIVTVITAVLLVVGRYGLVEKFSTFLVAGFTLVSMITVVLLQLQPEYAINLQNLIDGFSFRLPPPTGDKRPLATALATFGIIGVGANELMQYPYWCLEKGYARFTGPNDGTEAWAARARGWLRVLRWDAWCSMIIYTFATIAFYLLGAAILGRLHLVPKGTDMIRTLAMMYEPVFGGWTTIVFLIGAFAVLYSTFFVANAGHARVCANALSVFRRTPLPAAHERFWVQVFSGVFPFLCLVFYLVYPEPKALVLASGIMQAIMLPMLSFTAIYFRYRRIDPRVAPGLVWDIFLWISAFGMLICGGWLALTKLFPPLETWL